MGPLVREAERLAASADNPARLARVLVFRAYQHWTQAEYRTGQDVLDSVVAMAGAGAAPLPRRTGRIRGLLHFQLGEYRAALAALAAQEAEERVAGPPHGLLPTRLATVALHQVLALVELGEFDEALARADAGFQGGRELQHGYSLAMAATARGAIDARRGNAGGAVSALERARDLCRDGNYLLLLPGALGYLAAAYLLAGRVDDAVRAGREASEQGRPPYAFLDVGLGEACLAAGRGQEAREIAGRGV
jgi:tetratricopeptide (TPR) repeat protein